MQNTKAIFKTAWPYKDDAMNLPVADVESAIPFYESIMGFKLLSRKDSPNKSAVLGRDNIQIGLVENGGNPTQEGCFFEVDNVDVVFSELRSNGLEKNESDIGIEKHGETKWRLFYVVAPDGLCYCIGDRQNQ